METKGVGSCVLHILGIKHPRHVAVVWVVELKEFLGWFWTVCAFRKGRDGNAQWMAAQARKIENPANKTYSCRDFPYQFRQVLSFI